MAFGYAGKIAKVNLTTRTVQDVATSDYAPKFIGGRTLAAKLYWDAKVPPEAPAFDASNTIVFASGPASGTLSAHGSRTAVVGKSSEPMPECYQESVTGGDFSSELKFAGYDAVSVTGKASDPVYILARNGKIEILSAERLWGLGCYALDAEIRRLWGDNTSSMMIGPAGERMNIGGAAIICDLGHGTGQCGLGSVMGSKNLKCVSAIGTGKVTVAQPQEMIKFYNEDVKMGGRGAGGPYQVAFLAYEGGEGAPDFNSSSLHEWANWQTADWSDYFMNREEIKKGTIKVKYAGCFSTACHCQQATMLMSPRGDEPAPYNLDPPFSFGNQCHEYQYMNELTQAGYDGMSHGRPGAWDNFNQGDVGVSAHAVGSSWKWWREANELGLIPPELTGYPTTLDYKDWNTLEFCGPKGWTNAFVDPQNDWQERMSTGQMRCLAGMAKDFGGDWQMLYEKHVPAPYYHGGFTGGASNWRGEDQIHYAVQIRNYPNDPYGKFRSASSKQLGPMWPSAVKSDASAANREKWAPILGTATPYDLTGEDRTFEGKVISAIFRDHLLQDRDGTPGCGWAGYPRFYSHFTPDHLTEPISARMINCILGTNYTFMEYIDHFERAHNLERAIHIREGRRREHDSFSPGLWAKVNWTDENEWNGVMDEYYTARDWGLDTGVPSRAKLEELGMADVADELESVGAL